jgi:hypothetical protein
MAFDLVIATVLIPLGAWLAASRPPSLAAPPCPAAQAGSVSAEPSSEEPAPPARAIPGAALVALAAVVGCIGGIYGIGGGSILAPILIAAGRPASDVAPAALASTFLTSVAGVVTFAILAVHQHGSVAPDWPTGVALGLGGLAGAYTGARIQSRLPDSAIRRIVGVLVIAIGVRYLWSGLS